jgi:hypothetical protein
MEKVLRSGTFKIYQQAAYIQMMKLIYLRLLLEYAKRLADVVSTDNPAPNLRSFRGIADGEDSGIIGITENISFADGNQYGYIRFYDLTTSPTNPPIIEKEKLAEAFSGIPGRLAISGNYAYVATVMVGLQVVDIEAARNHTGMSDGSSIAGIYDTNGAGYKQPGDIVIYNGTNALLTTTSGHLLLLDINTTLPQLITPFKPEGYSAWRAGAADGFTYTRADGTPDTMDLAVTGSMQGRINTVNITDPYNPGVIGTAKDQSGNDVTIFATDIAVSKKSGLAFITAGQIIYVIDIKDPYNPRLLNTISSTTNADGTTVSLGYTTALVEKDGWVYLANQQQGMKVMELGANGLRRVCKNDPFCNDYYPALGDQARGGKKTVALYGFDQFLGPLNAPIRVKLNTSLSDLNTRGIIVTAENNQCPGALCATFNSGTAKFYIQTNDSLTGTDPIVLDFEVDPTSISGQTLFGQDGTTDYKATVTLAVKDNSNVTLGDVVSGRAVFAYDNGKSEGTYAEGVAENSRKFYYAQELLNQVVPRKRSVPQNFELLEEDGQYGDTTATALGVFKTNFNMGSIIVLGKHIGNTNVNLSNGQPTSADDTSDTFRKVMNSYSYTSQTQREYWLNKIIDKETLVGETSRIPSSGTSLTEDNADVRINGIPDDRNDTGLYELYKNVVERFNNKLIEEGDRYRTSIGSGANTSWKPRTYNAADPAKGDPEQTEGESYCFGCKNTYQDFWNDVTSCAPPAPGQVNASYAGNMNEDNCGFTGTKKYTGLKDTEQGSAPRYYAFTYWTGIDCAGFVQRIAMAAKNLTIPGVKCKIPDLKDTDADSNRLDDGSIPADQFIISNRSFSISSEKANKIKRGDVVQYRGTKGGRHVSMVYSPKTACDKDGDNCTYEIVHAYGWNKYDFDGDGVEEANEFSRKVVKTRQNIGSVPTGFGRIKLWD